MSGGAAPPPGSTSTDQEPKGPVVDPLALSPSGGRDRRVQARRWHARVVVALVALLVGRAGVVGWGALAAPVGAHTSLDSSEPANRSTVLEPPSQLTLRFTSEVDPRTVSVRLVDAAGSVLAPPERVTADDGPTATVAFLLPELEPGQRYGATWESVGDDGHRAQGEVVFAVGEGAAAGPVAGIGSDRWSSVLDNASAVARLGWYLALALAAGGLAVATWTASASGAAAGSLRRTARASWGYGVLAAAAAALARGVLAATTVARSRTDVGDWPTRLLEGYATRAGTLWVLTALLLVAAWRWSRASAGTAHEGTTAGSAPWVVGAAVVLGVLAGHGGSDRDPLLAWIVGTIHLAAAALWIGPLAVLTLTLGCASWRSLDRDERDEALRPVLRSYAVLAGAALAALVVTGTQLAWVRLGPRVPWNSYSMVLAVKVAVVAAVVVPLAWHHHRRVVSPDGPRLGTAGFARSVRLEALSLALVLALAAALVGADPRSGAPLGGSGATDAATSTTAGAAPALEPEVVDVSSCRDLAVGQANCYADHFEAVMERDGAGAAVARVQELYEANDPFVRADCHQITHDIGRAAAELYDSLADAFSFEASACWSGYYHGLVEHELSALSDDELGRMVGTLCQDAAAGGAYDFAHYNCVHGLGHGLMIRHDNDLFRVLPHCQSLSDHWEAVSCAGGAFMENVVAAQRGERATVRDDDLIYPCNAVEESLQDACYSMQTSHVLWKLDYDIPAAFALCDQVDPARIAACYTSMGRDISGMALLDVATIIEHCNLGAEAYREHCFAAAAANAVFNDSGVAMADALCDAVEPRFQAACRASRDRSASTL